MDHTPSTRGEPQRLPQRWAIIGVATVGAAAVAFVAAGIVAAIGTGAAVAVALHQIIA